MEIEIVSNIKKRTTDNDYFFFRRFKKENGFLLYYPFILFDHIKRTDLLRRFLMMIMVL